VWALIGIEDHEAAIEVACFPNTFQLYAPVLVPDAVVSIAGKIRKQETAEGAATVSFSAEGIELLDIDTARASGGRLPVVLSIREDKITPDVTTELRRILQAHPGEAPVHMDVTTPGRRRVRLSLAAYCVEPSSSFMADVKSLLGPSSVSL
jgi:DNA polymerase-3 subunit alpha